MGDTPECKCDYFGGPVRCPMHTPERDFGPVTAGQADRIIELLETLVVNTGGPVPVLGPAAPCRRPETL